MKRPPTASKEHVYELRTKPLTNAVGLQAHKRTCKSWLGSMIPASRIRSLMIGSLRLHFDKFGKPYAGARVPLPYRLASDWLMAAVPQKSPGYRVQSSVTGYLVLTRISGDFPFDELKIPVCNALQASWQLTAVGRPPWPR